MMRIDYKQPRLVGESAHIRAIHREIDAAARSDAKVLITGETGVGKDVVARLIHQASARSAAPLATLNCAGVPDSLMESELFGHVRGSFTGAYRDKPGILEAAAHGTVFLDEVGEMSLRMQAALLRFLETGEIQRVGADRVRGTVDVRVIAATNRELDPEIAGGAFRRDLYYRLNVLRIAIPPLRERKEDIPLLLEHFMGCYSRQPGAPARRFSEEALSRLVAYSWPGNIRQLKNVVERLVYSRCGATIEPKDLPAELRTPPSVTASGGDDSTGAALLAVEAELLSRMLKGGESFWSVVHAPFMNRDLCREHLKSIVAHGLQLSGGNYRVVVELFNMQPRHYRRFLGFLQKHHCQVPFRSFRVPSPATARAA
jgi:transcriptional regulator with PAS, ATPase and Fis domain